MGALGASIFWFKSANELVEARSSQLQIKNAELSRLANEIRLLDNRQEELRVRSSQLEQAVIDRSWWVRLLNDLNQQFDNDLIWLPVVEVLKDGKAITKPLWGGEKESNNSSNDTKNAAQAAPVYQLRVRGLYRKNTEGEQKVVYDFAAKLAKLEAFDMPDFETKRDNYVKVDSGVDEERYAYHFEIKMPLRKPLQFQ